MEPRLTGGGAAVEPTIKHEHAADVPADAADASGGQPRQLQRAELTALVDACAAVRVPGAPDDCTHQAMLVLRLLRGGDPAALTADDAAASIARGARRRTASSGGSTRRRSRRTSSRSRS